MMYHIGELVIYGIQGVCRVIGTEQQQNNRGKTEYLVLEPLEKAESRFLLPMGNTSVMKKLKRILTKDEMTAMLSSGLIRKDCWIPEENLRKQHYRDLISGGDRISLLQMIVSLYRHKEERAAAGRKFHQCDENFLRDAEKLLSAEVALVMGLSREEALEYLRSQLR